MDTPIALKFGTHQGHIEADISSYVRMNPMNIHSVIVGFPLHTQINFLTVVTRWCNSHLNTAAVAVNFIAALVWKSIKMSANH